MVRKPALSCNDFDGQIGIAQERTRPSNPEPLNGSEDRHLQSVGKGALEGSAENPDVIGQVFDAETTMAQNDTSKTRFSLVRGLVLSLPCLTFPTAIRYETSFDHFIHLNLSFWRDALTF